MRSVVLTNHDTLHAEIRYLVEQAGLAQTELAFRRIRLDAAEKAPFAPPALTAADALQAVGALRAARAHAADPGGRLEEEEALVVLLDGNLQSAEDDEYFFAADPDERVAVASAFHLSPGSSFMGKDDWWSQLGAAEQQRLASGSIVLTLFGAVTALLTGLEPHDETRSCVMDYCQRPRDIREALRDGVSFCAPCQDALRPSPEGQALLRIAEQLRRNPPRHAALDACEFDVLLAHREADRDHVLGVAATLRERGVRTWPELEDLRQPLPPSTWDPAMLGRVRTVAAFVGGSGAGPWTELPSATLVRAAVGRELPLVVVVMAGAPDPALPPDLAGRPVVDLRRSDADPVSQLVWTLTGDGSTQPSTPGVVPPPQQLVDPRHPGPPAGPANPIVRWVAPLVAALAVVALAVQLARSGSFRGLPVGTPPPRGPAQGPELDPVPPDVEAFRARKDRALLVATNTYRGPEWKELGLQYPVSDAQRLEAALKARGFETTLLTDPPYRTFVEHLDRLARLDCGPYDQLLLFVSGHGAFSSVWGSGHLILSDSAGDERTVWFPVLRDRLARLEKCRHVLLVVDTCYAGTFDPAIADGMSLVAASKGGAVLDEAAAMDVLRYPSHRFLGSVGKGRAPDQSAFANALIEALESAQGDGFLTDFSLIANVQGVTPRPVFWAFGHDSAAGGFVVPPRSTGPARPPP